MLPCEGETADNAGWPERALLLSEVVMIGPRRVILCHSLEYCMQHRWGPAPHMTEQEDV